MIPFVDLVIGGPDMSGTSTQVNDIIEFFKSRGKAVRDLRGTEIEALFHAVMFSEYNDDYLSLSEFLDDPKVLESSKMKTATEPAGGGNEIEFSMLHVISPLVFFVSLRQIQHDACINGTRGWSVIFDFAWHAPTQSP